jgi:phage terminase small subunit
LITGHERNKADRKRREAAEKSMTPVSMIEKVPPPELKGHPYAQNIWRRTVKIYGELEAKIISGLDRDHLVDYCMASEEVMNITKDLLRARQSQETLDRKIAQVKDKEALAELMEHQNAGYRLIINLNGRADRKRKICMIMRNDLYLTPKSRAGVVPGGKPPEPPPDPMGDLLKDD